MGEGLRTPEGLLSGQLSKQTCVPAAVTTLGSWVNPESGMGSLSHVPAHVAQGPRRGSFTKIQYLAGDQWLPN